MARPTATMRQKSFSYFWQAQAVGQTGAQIAGFSIPVLAVAMIGATELQVGLISAAGGAAFLAVGLQAGAIVDRLPKRRILVAADLARALAMASLLLFWITGVLNVWHLVIVGFLAGAARVFADVASQSFVPILVDKNLISRANAKLEATAQIARLLGPAASGILLTMLVTSAVLAIPVLTYFAAIAAVRRISVTENKQVVKDRRAMRFEIIEGVRFVYGHPALRRIVLSTGIGNLFFTFGMTVAPILLLRVLDFSPAMVGVAASVGALGGARGGSNRTASQQGDWS